MLGDFSVLEIFLLSKLILNEINSEYTLCDFNILQTHSVRIQFFSFCGGLFYGKHYRIWSILVCDPWALKKHVFRVWNILYKFISSYWFVALLSSPVSLLVFCLSIWWIIERSVLNFPNIIVNLFLFSVFSVLASHILQLCCLVHTYLKLPFSLGVVSLLSLCIVPLCLC